MPYDYSSYEAYYELPGKIKCRCSRRARKEKEERIARLEASRRIVRRERKIRDLGEVLFLA